MSIDLPTLYPQKLWEIFQNILLIPRPSKKEAEIVEYVKKKGESLGLETRVDDTGNVLIIKPASAGGMRKKTVILQSHLDMVPQKNSDVIFDFEKDAVKAKIDGEWVSAEGTTLGADNGIGVAAALTILESTDIEHGPLQALFTVDEETGMTGAFGLQPGWLQGDVLINLDSENEGELIIGCAGGINTIVTLPYAKEPVKNSCSFRITVAGLKGGHSGVDIHLGRGNANKILARLLLLAEESFPFQLSEFHGGGMRNAIPREAEAVVSIVKDKAEGFISFCNDHFRTLKEELALKEPDLRIDVNEAESPKQVIDSETAQKLIHSLCSCPDGVISMSESLPGVVETSSNLATVKTEEEHIVIELLQRSSQKSLRDDICLKIRDVFERAGGRVEHIDPYPGWKPNPESLILKVMKDVFKKRTGRLPQVSVIHAGLESGLIGDMYPEMDLISCGPTIKFPHSPHEKVNIASVGRFFDFLKDTLENIPLKE